MAPTSPPPCCSSGPRLLPAPSCCGRWCRLQDPPGSRSHWQAGAAPFGRLGSHRAGGQRRRGWPRMLTGAGAIVEHRVLPDGPRSVAGRRGPHQGLDRPTLAIRRRACRLPDKDTDHATHRHPPSHRRHRQRARQPRLLHPDARPAAGEEDRQPGRRQRLPPVLCRRARLARHRHHLLRLAGRARAARHAQHHPHRLARRRRRHARLVEAALPGPGRHALARSSSAMDGSRSTSRTSRASASASSTTAGRASVPSVGAQPRAGRAPDPRPRPDHHQRARAATTTDLVLTQDA